MWKGKGLHLFTIGAMIMTGSGCQRQEEVKSSGSTRKVAPPPFMKSESRYGGPLGRLD